MEVDYFGIGCDCSATAVGRCDILHRNRRKIVHSLGEEVLNKNFSENKIFLMPFDFCKNFQEKFHKKYEKNFLTFSEPESCGVIRILFEPNKFDSETKAYPVSISLANAKKKGNLFSRLPFTEKTPLHYGMKITTLYYFRWKVCREFQGMVREFRQFHRSR